MSLIPPSVLRLLLAFCARKATGEIVLRVYQGRLTAYTVSESGKICDLDTREIVTYAETIGVSLEDIVR